MTENSGNGAQGNEETLSMIKEFRVYRESNPGSTSYKAMEFWLKNGKQDRPGYRWNATDKRTKRKRKAMDLREKLNKAAKMVKVDELLPIKKEEDTSGGKNVIIHIH